MGSAAPAGLSGWSDFAAVGFRIRVPLDRVASVLVRAKMCWDSGSTPGLVVGDVTAGLGAGEVLERELVFRPGILPGPSSALILRMAVVAVSFLVSLDGPFLMVAGVGGVIVVAVVGVARGGPGVKVEELFGPILVFRQSAITSSHA